MAKQNNPLTTAIYASTSALNEMIKKVNHDCDDAVGYANSQNRNATVGTVMCMESVLQDALALCATIKILQRQALHADSIG